MSSTSQRNSSFNVAAGVWCSAGRSERVSRGYGNRSSGGRRIGGGTRHRRGAELSSIIRRSVGPARRTDARRRNRARSRVASHSLADQHNRGDRCGGVAEGRLTAARAGCHRSAAFGLLTGVYERIFHADIDLRAMLRDIERIAQLRHSASVAPTIVAYTSLCLAEVVKRSGTGRCKNVVYDHAAALPSFD